MRRAQHIAEKKRRGKGGYESKIRPHPEKGKADRLGNGKKGGIRIHTLNLKKEKPLTPNRRNKKKH